LRVAVLVKQIPAFQEMALGPDGRLVREGLPLEMNAYCRRAVALAADVVAAAGGEVVLFTLGPPAAEDVLREGIAWCLDHGADARGVHVCDPAFAGSDTLATAVALCGALDRTAAEAGAAWDLVLLGRNSVDADTGQVGPELAQLLGLPFAQGVREVTLAGEGLRLRLEHDDEWVDVAVGLPAVLTCAERLIDPSKVPPDGRAAVPAERIERCPAGELGEGPWGQHASPTRVGETRVLEVDRLRKRLDGPVAQQVAEAMAILDDRGALDPTVDPSTLEQVPSNGGDGPAIVVVTEPGRRRLARELLGDAARLAHQLGGRVVAVGQHADDDLPLAAWGADHLVELDAESVLPSEEDVAAAVTTWVEAERPWAVLAPGTLWGREVASRLAAAIGAGLTGDAVGFAVDDGRLLAWKPAFGGMLVAGITSTSAVQIATVRPGVLGEPAERAADEAAMTCERLPVPALSRLQVLGREREDLVDALEAAEVVVAVGQGVSPDRYGELDRLLAVLDAQLGATRKVTDAGWLPRALQIGITGHSISPRLCVLIGTSGKFNHTVGVRGSGTVLGIGLDPDAPLWEHCDVGLTADWAEAVPLLADALVAAVGPLR
jgi:electron transfer flavoprotein alpha subunit/electron transfer flavoprotein alpha/beta subunit